MPDETSLAPARRIPDQSGRTWLVTGATHGLGLEVVRSVADAGGRMLLPVRDTARGAAVAEELRARGGDVVVGRLDLADLDVVRDYAASVDEPVDVLVNNAGTVSPSRRETADGFELLLGTNALGPFALTNLLADRVRDRVVVVASNAHLRGRFDEGDPHFRRRRWNVSTAYAQSKLADLLWARALEPRLAALPAGAHVQLAHPGWAFTNLHNVTGSATLDRLVGAVTEPFAQSSAEGAWPVLVAAVRELEPLTYWGPNGRLRLRGRPVVQRPASHARDAAAAERFWAFAAAETGTDLPAPAASVSAPAAAAAAAPSATARPATTRATTTP